MAVSSPATWRSGALVLELTRWWWICFEEERNISVSFAIRLVVVTTYPASGDMSARVYCFPRYFSCRDYFHWSPAVSPLGSTAVLVPSGTTTCFPSAITLISSLFCYTWGLRYSFLYRTKQLSITDVFLAPCLPLYPLMFPSFCHIHLHLILQIPF